MGPEDSLKMWLERNTELEDALIDAIKVIKALEQNADWTPKQRIEIQNKLQQLQNKLIPF